MRRIPVPRLIRELAPRYGIDPVAAIAVARGEGGLVNREGDVGDLAGGGSYGPFQLYTKGALPKQFHGRPEAADAWAWSPAGIDYALRKMKESGASGLRGAHAVERIIREFERPADPDKSVALALGRLGAEPAQTVTGPSRIASELATTTTPPAAPDGRRAFAQQLLAAQKPGGGLDTQALLGAVLAKRAADQTPAAVSAGQPLDADPEQSQAGGGTGSWQEWVGAPERRTGPSKPHTPEILQFVGRVGQIAQTRLTPWGNESHSLTTVNGNPSAHGSGHAADIPARGAELVRLGQAALIAAGMPPEQARKQTGGLFNVGRHQIIFNTGIGGDHTDHLHTGIRGG